MREVKAERLDLESRWLVQIDHAFSIPLSEASTMSRRISPLQEEQAGWKRQLGWYREESSSRELVSGTFFCGSTVLA